MVEILLMADGFMKPVTISEKLYHSGDIEIGLKESQLYVIPEPLKLPKNPKILRFERNGRRRLFDEKMLDIFECKNFL